MDTASDTARLPSRDADRPLRARERRQLLLLGLPTLALALAVTTVSTYLPVVARRFTGSTTVIGLIIAAEGAMALWVPLLAGNWSDRARTRLGRRLPFLIAGAPIMGIALALMGVVSSIVGLGLVVALFFWGYFVAYEPYRALYPDLLDSEQVAGRAQSTQALWRGLATILALLGGGLLLSLGRAVPFATAAVVVVVVTASFVAAMVRTRSIPRRAQLPTPDSAHLGVRSSVARTAGRVVTLISAHPALRAYLVANALWEAALAALKTFIVLYLTQGLGVRLNTAALLIAAVAVAILLGAAIAGKLADRLGRLRVMTWSLPVYGAALLIPALTTTRPVIGAVAPVIAVGGGIVMTLAYAVLMPLMPEDEHGTLTGFYSLSRGLGGVIGPVLAGVLVQQLRRPFSSTHGYAAMWLVCSGAVLLSVVATRALTARAQDRKALGSAA